MFAEQRQQRIVEQARQAGRVDVAELAAELAVTPETVRRDLTALERQGVLRRVHGGAMPVERLGFEPGLAARDAVRRPRRSGSPRRPCPSCRSRARSCSTPAPPPPAWPRSCRSTAT